MTERSGSTPKIGAVNAELMHGQSATLLTETSVGRSELLKLAAVYVEEMKEIPDCIDYKIFTSFLSNGLNDMAEAVVFYMMLSTIRVVRHEASHLCALLSLGKPLDYKLRSVTFSRSNILDVLIETEIGAFKPVFLKKGGVHAWFGKIPQSALSAFTSIMAPELLEIKLKFSISGVDYSEGGMGSADSEQIAQLEELLEKNGYDSESMLDRAKGMLIESEDELRSQVNEFTRYLYPHVIRGRTVFKSRELKDIYRVIVSK